eukprot:TRINITY_DN438_c0_g1_i1.p1 TRINITY_DN438_c0_g1~~TRINITY_DN438_c0_g1_i1.p1  ORF type:complete len:270 (+),score=54.86 TRINITY_DN438_c0_g1_i1:23-811(+)
MKFAGCHFIVTGGASGLGEASTLALVGQGANVTIFDINEEKANTLISQHPKNIKFVEVDITSEESIANAVDAAHKLWGRIDGVINCAGAGLAMSTVDKRTGEAHDMGSFEFVVRLNLIGTFSVASKCAAIMAKQDPSADGERGVIVNVASVAAFDGQNGQAAYAASKGGVAAMTIAMARDLSRLGIRVLTVAPGIFATPMTAGMRTEAGRRVGEPLLKAQCFPRDRFGLPEEFGSLVLELVRNTFLNGETIRLDAGVRMPKM